MQNIFKILSVITFVLFQLHIYAETEKILKIGMAEFPPFKFLDENGKAVGSDTEIILEVIKNMSDKNISYKQEINVAPWARVQENAQLGMYDFIYTFTQTPERDNLYYFSDPISSVRDVFFKRKTSKIEWNSLSDLFKYKVGISNGYKYSPEMMDAISTKKFARIQNIYEEKPEKLNLKLLAHKRIDILICEVSVCQFLLKTDKTLIGDKEVYDKIDFIDRSVGEERFFRAGFPKFPKNPVKDIESQKLRDVFNAGLAKVSVEKKKEIFKKYGMKIKFLE